MIPAESSLLREIIDNTEKRIRPRGDARLAAGLQSAGFVTIEYLDDGARLRVSPTQAGRRWVALVARQQAAGKVA